MESFISIRNKVPQVLNESRDFNVFLKLLDIIYQTNKYDIDNWIKLYDITECPYEFLSMLADFVGYEYDNTVSISESRIILKNFISLLKNRGSKIGLTQAISIILNAKLASEPNNDLYKKMVDQLSFLEVYYDLDTGIITYYFPEEIEYNSNVLDYARPIGTYIDIKVAEFPEPESDIAINTHVSAIKHQDYVHTVERNSQGVVTAEDSTYNVNSAQVNLSQIGQMENSDLEENT